MSTKKAAVRDTFRRAVFERARYKCEGPHCAHGPTLSANELDAHHVTDRNDMPNGGYVKENGIALCKTCHRKAEQHHETGGVSWVPGYHPDELYQRIGSSKDAAEAASRRLG